MSDDKKLSRRDTLKLASAVSALGVGLGVTLDSKDAEAAPTVAGERMDQLAIKLYKLGRDGQHAVVSSFDVGALSHKQAKDIAGQYTIKLYNIKLDKQEVLLESAIELTAAQK
jgi:hypothetical protein